MSRVRQGHASDEQHERPCAKASISQEVPVPPLRSQLRLGEQSRPPRATPFVPPLEAEEGSWHPEGPQQVAHKSACRAEHDGDVNRKAVRQSKLKQV